MMSSAILFITRNAALSYEFVEFEINVASGRAVSNTVSEPNQPPDIPIDIIKLCRVEPKPVESYSKYFWLQIKLKRNNFIRYL